jgi:hypothetical protein
MNILCHNKIQIFIRFLYTVRSESHCALRLWYRDRPRTLNELKSAITVYIRNISQADLQKVFANKIKWVQACTDTRGHHFQHLL